ncbi:hypothetical protein, partial [Vibrio atlanticus]|uniref:hypothetical protein n=1 Tax=Vibrio atlanticus TaxID=693153 RepID=UPI00354D8D84
TTRKGLSVWQLTKVFGCHQEGLILDDCLPDSIVNQTKFDSNTRHLNVFVVFIPFLLNKSR